MTVVEIVEKTWHTFLRVGELVPVTKQKDPNLRVVFFIRYKLETCHNVTTIFLIWGLGQLSTQ